MLCTVALVCPAGSSVSGSTSTPMRMPGMAASGVGATVGVGIVSGVGGSSRPRRASGSPDGVGGWQAAARLATAPRLSRRSATRRVIMGAIVDFGCSMPPRTLFEKILDAHVVRDAPGEPTLLYIDLHLIHEVTTPQAFEGLRLS